MEKLARLAAVIKTAKRSLQTNYLLAVLVIGFMLLYLHDHAKLQQFQQQPILQKANKIDHKARLRKRSERILKICEDFNNSMKLEHNAVYYKEKTANPCTGTYFRLKERSHFICNVLKGGSTSWEMFFKENKIPSTKIVDCDTEEENCSNSPEVKIIQVRHPFERLLSTYRHVFKNGGWKSLDASYVKEPNIEQFFIRFFSKSWPDFVDEVIIQNQMDITEDNLRNINYPGNIIYNSNDKSFSTLTTVMQICFAKNPPKETYST